MTKSLNDMSVTEAASKALELIVRAGFDRYYKDSDTKFEDYVASEYFEDDDTLNYDVELEQYVPVEESTKFDTDRVWQRLHGEGYKGSYDGLTAECEASYGGEGEGDQYWMVISLSDGSTTRYFRRDGWYASYDGGYLDGETYEVHPKEKTVVVYE